MIRYFFSFGQVHTHRYGEVTLDCDSIVQIDAPDYGAAREKMVDHFGQAWHMQYTDETYQPEYFPRGVVLHLTVPA